MALEISTAGVGLRWCVETTAGTRPTTGYQIVPSIKETPDFNPEPSTLEVTDLSDLVWKRYIAGLKDPGGALSFTANLTSSFKTAWEGVVSAYNTGIASSKATWFEIVVPTVGSFYFSGIPSTLGINGMSVDEVAEVSVYITPNQIHGWDTTSTLASN
jgi:hypothetical protein